jgi:hypothetical protein
MLACDIIVQARAAKRLSQEEIVRLERMVFSTGAPSREGVEAVLLIDRYIPAGDDNWSALLDRVAAATSPLADAPALPQAKAA